jgi:hypothetical protein
MEPAVQFGLGQYAARFIIVTWTDGEKLTKVLDSEKVANQLIVIKHRNTTSSFNSCSAERNGEKINVTVRTTIREELPPKSQPTMTQKTKDRVARTPLKVNLP